ncbi:VPLPA-CTERM sorting domain-containing protein [Methylomonas sp. SURF-2]|uniref:VPLPA-CTERM sorting domain-containing protein n=1 Tax=Methylomonas subterranea TaxID=2952225 RepID=A0ABT1TER9_9GAMM|nr:VPLPA-CTERM sorting domain-containing protein [Methylomonas sp. SURF-2]MCQ8103964.1 VPLPA-CTERM sorting domain-containing protein [Methylomonas sp. SURF-2]
MKITQFAAVALMGLSVNAAQAAQFEFDATFFGNQDLQEYRFDVLSDSSVSMWTDTLTNGLDSRLTLFKLNTASGEYEWNTGYAIADAFETNFNPVLGYNPTGVNDFGVALKNGFELNDPTKVGISDAGGTLNLTQGSYLLVHTFENYWSQAEFDFVDGAAYSAGYVDTTAPEYFGFGDTWTSFPYGNKSQPHAYKLFVSGDVALPTSVPVPGAVWLFGSALAGLTAASRRKQRIAA